MKQLSIQEVKHIELEILTSFADFCDKNNLTYFLAYGTLLGAVRHSGFIPWDDDIDVIMPRPDYDRFIQMTGFCPIKDNLTTRLYDFCAQPNIYPFAKIIDDTTIVKEKGKSEKDISGIWIDIFPLDGFPAEWDKCVRLFNKYVRLRHQQDLLTTNPKIYKRNLPTLIAKSFARIILKFIGIKQICGKMDKLARTYDYNISKYAGDLLWGDKPEERMPKKTFENYTYVTFEGRKFKAPKDYDAYLKQIYGNYMELPPEEERQPHGFTAFRI